MKKVKGIIAAGLVLSMAVPFFTGCSCSKGGGGDTISADDPWFNVNRVEIDNGLSGADIEYSYMEYVGLYGDNFIFHLNGSYRYPNDFDFENGDTLEYRIDELREYDISGNLINSVDCVDLLRAMINNSDCDNGYSNGIEQDEEGYYVTINGYNSSTGDSSSFVSRIDFENGSFSTPVEQNESDKPYIERLESEGAFQENSFTVGEYTIDRFWVSGDVFSYVLEVTDSQGVTTEYDFRQIFPGKNISDIRTIIDVGDNKALIVGYGDGSSIFFDIDFVNKTVTENTTDLEFLVSKVAHMIEIEGIGTVVKDVDGIYSINFADKTTEPLFLFSYANLNMYELRNLTPISINENSAIFAGETYSPSEYVPSKTVMYIFDRADSNPNAGKSYLDLASASDYSYALCDAVCRFNETNPDYYIRLDSKYNLDLALSVQAISDTSNQTDEETMADNTATSLGNQLAVDIMSGTGPDIIVNGQQFSMLNNDSYLMDLSSFVSENCGSDNYFTNVFEASRDGDALYQLPVTFKVHGIVANESDVAPGQIGFTFDQYADFVSGPCNGSDPIDKGQLYFFINSLSCMSELFDADGYVDYDNEAFRALAEYTAANVNEALVADEEDYYSFVDETTNPAKLVTITDVAQYFDSVKIGNKVLLGIPSYDGRGAVIMGGESVAISSLTDAPDACKEFVSLLLSDDVQEIYGYKNGIPVNRTSFEAVCNKFIEFKDLEIDLMRSFMTEAEMRSRGINPDPLDSSVINEFELFINELTGWYTYDATVNAIIREEMPAYFAGQKTLDQVVPVLEDRIQTFMNERV